MHRNPADRKSGSLSLCILHGKCACPSQVESAAVADTRSYSALGVGRTAWRSGACLVDFLFGLEEGLCIGFYRRPAAGRSSIWATLMYWADGRSYVEGGAGG